MEKNNIVRKFYWWGRCFNVLSGWVSSRFYPFAAITPATTGWFVNVQATRISLSVYINIYIYIYIISKYIRSLIRVSLNNSYENRFVFGCNTWLSYSRPLTTRCQIQLTFWFPNSIRNIFWRTGVGLVRIDAFTIERNSSSIILVVQYRYKFKYFDVRETQ